MPSAQGEIRVCHFKQQYCSKQEITVDKTSICHRFSCVYVGAIMARRCLLAKNVL